MSLFSRVKSALLYTKIVIKKIFSTKYSIERLDQFALDAQLLTVYLKKDFFNLQASGMVDLWEAVVDNTPVDLGLAQHNWQLGSHNDGSILYREVLEAREQGVYWKPKGEKRERIVPYPDKPEIDEFKDMDKIVLFNNIPYIDNLESGSSPQKGPGQMLKDNVQKMEAEIKQKLKETGLFK